MGQMTYVGLDPQKAGELAQHLDEAARDLENHAVVVAQLLDQAGIHSSTAPAEIRDVAAWAAYRSRDLKRRIAEILVADSGSAGPKPNGFRFAHRDDARQAGDDAADTIRSLLDGRHAEKLAAQLAKAKAYLADARYASAFFKGLGPKATFALLSRVRGNDLLIVGRALALAQKDQKLGKPFFDRVLAAAKRQAAALYSYEHHAGAIDIRDRQAYATQKFERGVTAPPGAYDFLDTIAPITPLVEAGAKVAVVGSALFIVTMGGACVLTTDGTCLGPAAAFGEEAVLAFGDKTDVIAGMIADDGAAVGSPLSGAEDAVVDAVKVYDYALNPDHPVGGDKARVFESALGFTRSNADLLIGEIRAGVLSRPAQPGIADEFGARFTVDIPVVGPNGSSAVVRTGWIYDPESEFPRLVTLFVL
ncbi:MAG: hypothetical protein E6G57_15340 [Actinobacteria bacterium]|nr:MAG: hypothetical protein E6G57_15340 [Actinomycetota bacterium]